MKLYPKYGFKVSPNYTIKEVIGKGSYGTVAAAVETSYGAQVAIKKVTNIFTRDILLKSHTGVKVHEILQGSQEHC